MGRYKQLNSPMLSLCGYNRQVAEALAGVKAMNKVIRLGMPVRQQLASISCLLAEVIANSTKTKSG
ncbi:hypothetical protein TUM4641_27130 [Shewanella morhuae]|nr:hypothetical protein TUM4641_27130 [Shewanella morhuae]